MIKEIRHFKNFKWIQVSEPNPTERKQLIGQFNLTNELIFYATDPNESARMEYDNVNHSMLMIFDVVTPEGAQAVTSPIGVIFQEGHLFTFTNDVTEYINDTFLHPDNNQAALPDDQISALDVVLNGLYSLVTDYVTALVGINRRRKGIQERLSHAKYLQKEVNALLELETNLIYYLNSLQSNIAVLEGLKRHESERLTSFQNEHIEDILVELRQATDMATMAQDVVTSVSNAYSNLVNNDLNWTMKILTVFSILLTVPTIVSGFWGENVKLPLMNNPYGWQITIAIMFIIMAIFSYFLWKGGLFRK